MNKKKNISRSLFQFNINNISKNSNKDNISLQNFNTKGSNIIESNKITINDKKNNKDKDKDKNFIHKKDKNDNIIFFEKTTIDKNYNNFDKHIDRNTI